MAQTIIAQKGKLRKRFNLDSWNLLKDKNGWVEVEQSNQVVESSVVKRIVPNSGQKKDDEINQVVENTAPANVPEQFVTNTAKSQIEPKEEFANFVKDNIFKSQIKDYFDAENVPYKNSMSLNALITLLYEKLGSIEKLKIAFKFKVEIAGL